MTKDQKVTEITDLVQEMRKRYTFQEFADMVIAIWNALDTATTKAQENTPS